MGYSTSPRLVEANEHLLEEILNAVNKNERILLDGGDNVSTKQYQLRRILAACDRHPDALSGRYSGLGKKIALRVEGTKISVEPKATVSLVKVLPTEEDALRNLAVYRGNLEVLSFKPSSGFSEAGLAARLKNLGWILHTTTKQELEDGMISYAVERVEQTKTGFDVLSH